LKFTVFGSVIGSLLVLRAVGGLNKELS
jgi:hypothetical protein